MYQDLLPGKYALRMLRYLADRAGDEHTSSLANRALYGRTREERRKAHRECNRIVADGRYADAAPMRDWHVARALGEARRVRRAEHAAEERRRCVILQLSRLALAHAALEPALQAREACEVTDLASRRNSRA